MYAEIKIRNYVRPQETKLYRYAFDVCVKSLERSVSEKPGADSFFFFCSRSHGNGCELPISPSLASSSADPPLHIARVISIPSGSCSRTGRLQDELSLLLSRLVRRDSFFQDQPFLFPSSSIQVTIYPEWNSEWLTPWVHYVPVKLDLSDVYRE